MGLEFRSASGGPADALTVSTVASIIFDTRWCYCLHRLFRLLSAAMLQHCLAFTYCRALLLLLLLLQLFCSSNCDVCICCLASLYWLDSRQAVSVVSRLWAQGNA